jgi:hypothetical protein
MEGGARPTLAKPHGVATAEADGSGGEGATRRGRGGTRHDAAEAEARWQEGDRLRGWLFPLTATIQSGSVRPSSQLEARGTVVLCWRRHRRTRCTLGKAGAVEAKGDAAPCTCMHPLTPQADHNTHVTPTQGHRRGKSSSMLGTTLNRNSDAGHKRREGGRKCMLPLAIQPFDAELKHCPT